MSRERLWIRCGRDVGWDGGYARHRCARRDTRNVRDPQSLTGIDRGRASHAVTALQLRVGDIVGDRDAKECVAALYDIIAYPAGGRSTGDDCDRWYRRNV